MGDLQKVNKESNPLRGNTECNEQHLRMKTSKGSLKAKSGRLISEGVLEFKQPALCLPLKWFLLVPPV